MMGTLLWAILVVVACEIILGGEEMGALEALPVRGSQKKPGLNRVNESCDFRQ